MTSKAKADRSDEVATGDTAVIMPLALTDFAKAFRELLATFREVAGLVRDGHQLLRRGAARKRAKDLDYLSFPAGGMLRPLSRIASGHALVETDFAELDELTGESSEAVAASVRSLNNYPAIIREHCGKAVADKLDHLIDGPAGKFVIRHEIHQLVNQYRTSASKGAISSKATEIIQMIQHFNASLVVLHDEIFPPTGAPK